MNIVTGEGANQNVKSIINHPVEGFLIVSGTRNFETEMQLKVLTVRAQYYSRSL